MRTGYKQNKVVICLICQSPVISIQPDLSVLLQSLSIPRSGTYNVSSNDHFLNTLGNIIVRERQSDHKRDMRFDKTIFYNQFHEFASPAGCGYITSRNVGIIRRLVWVIFIVTGKGIFCSSNCETYHNFNFLNLCQLKIQNVKF